MNESEHREITRLCARVAQLLLGNGAESALVTGITVRLGEALGVDQVECTLTANSVVLSAIKDEHCITTARRVGEHGINMTTVAAVQRIVLAAEAGRIDTAGVHAMLDRVPRDRYPHWVVIPMVALSCACFARLAGADWLGCTVTLIAAFFGMIVRVNLAKRHFNAFIVFSATGFTATLIAGEIVHFQLVDASQAMMAASVLMLVPGFPLINSLSDVLKGYMNMGIGRWMWATVLTLAACLGIIFGLFVVGLDVRVLL